ncbi:uncharacterized protein SPSK_03738 [Sporothrix schenckii 1099-18]|uniref:Uncharacterized protein n=1 Tax=Sporothrix schenckii 1099-18 TaxID=1397361 RepID=A0A0F2LXP3_SPOSC|nr:uncharacterized protein SPSK_03738 [Sporothrix schenckii 1099-18]KJR82228.1 hypothetical protein SPSK_03738 [Sporothrix schenckii 1099-18]
MGGDEAREGESSRAAAEEGSRCVADASRRLGGDESSRRVICRCPRSAQQLGIGCYEVWLREGNILNRRGGTHQLAERGWVLRNIEILYSGVDVPAKNGSSIDKIVEG